MLHRHDSVHRTLMNLFAPLFAGDGYLTWKMTILRQGLETHVAEASKLARRWAQGKTAANAQEVLFDVIDQFVAQRWTWMPGLLFRVYQEHGVGWAPSGGSHETTSTIFPRSVHHHIRTLAPAFRPVRSVTASLSGDRAVYGVGGLARTQVERGEPDAAALLDLFEPWGPHIKSVLNHDLRNSIGHGHATHNLESGRIEGPKLDLSYPEFVSKVTSAIEVPLLLLEIVKYQLILSEAALDGPRACAASTARQLGRSYLGCRRPPDASVIRAVGYCRRSACLRTSASGVRSHPTGQGIVGPLCTEH